MTKILFLIPSDYDRLERRLERISVKLLRDNCAKMPAATKLLIIAAMCLSSRAEVEFDSEPEIMIAQESRQYRTSVKPPKNIHIFKPQGITNSHRPQYNIDSEEDFSMYESTTKKKGYQGFKVRDKEGVLKEAVLRALERKDHVGKFAQVMPIIRSMSETQREALASLVARQVTTPVGRSPLNLAQVRSMFGNHKNTSSELMLPILLDTANLIRKAIGPGKATRQANMPPQAQMLRRSMTVQDDDDDDDDHTNDDTQLNDDPFETSYEDTTTTKAPRVQSLLSQIRSRQRVRNAPAIQKNTNQLNNSIVETSNDTNNTNTEHENKTTPRVPSTTEAIRTTSVSRSVDNGTTDLTADATNQTLIDAPVAEKLRAFNRYVDRKGNLTRRSNPKAPSSVSTIRRSTPGPALQNPAWRRPPPARKLPQAAVNDGNCELFTNSLCLHSEDYPKEAILLSIRRNKAATGALLADYKDPGEGAVDGVTAQQEAKYTADHYLVSNRRGDTAQRDFAGAGEAGFMCPSTVKYARPQRARATSGQWKYIVNTGEHTQTLRLEKCLKPKESCTYLTDNFKSKCVQVYNYHRLLTWDQQNGLHMDIFKVPTCCSCHIEGYSVNFPPLGHRVHETSSENFPGEDLSAEHGNGAFESVQSSIKRPSIAKIPHAANFPAIGENHNFISNNKFPTGNMDEDESNPHNNPMDSYGNSYFPDSFNQASSIRNVKRAPTSKHTNGDKTLPSYLEPPTPASPASFSFVKEPPSKYKITNSSHFKRGQPRPVRRPIRKTTSGVPEDIVSAGTSAVESNTNIESLEDFNYDLEDPDFIVKNNTPSVVTIAPKLPFAEPSSTNKPTEVKNQPSRQDNTGKRVNYNYHPIIDFFDEDKVDPAIDREDSTPEFSYVQSEWKPMNQPLPTDIPHNVVGRKKHGKIRIQ